MKKLILILAFGLFNLNTYAQEEITSNFANYRYFVSSSIIRKFPNTLSTYIWIIHEATFKKFKVLHLSSNFHNIYPNH